MIRTQTVYETKGEQFPTFKKAVEHREGLVEKFLRQSPGFPEMPNKFRIAFIQHILDNRDVVRDLLDFSSKMLVDDDE